MRRWPSRRAMLTGAGRALSAWRSGWSWSCRHRGYSRPTARRRDRGRGGVEDVSGPLYASAGSDRLPGIRWAGCPCRCLEEFRGLQASERHQAGRPAGRPREPGPRAGATVDPRGQAGQAGHGDRPGQARRTTRGRRGCLGPRWRPPERRNRLRRPSRRSARCPPHARGRGRSQLRPGRPGRGRSRTGAKGRSNLSPDRQGRWLVVREGGPGLIQPARRRDRRPRRQATQCRGSPRPRRTHEGPGRLPADRGGVRRHHRATADASPKRPGLASTD